MPFFRGLIIKGSEEAVNSFLPSAPTTAHHISQPKTEPKTPGWQEQKFTSSLRFPALPLSWSKVKVICLHPTPSVSHFHIQTFLEVEGANLFWQPANRAHSKEKPDKLVGPVPSFKTTSAPNPYTHTHTHPYRAAWINPAPSLVVGLPSHFQWPVQPVWEVKGITVFWHLNPKGKGESCPFSGGWMTRVGKAWLSHTQRFRTLAMCLFWRQSKMGHQEHKILCALCTFVYLAFSGQILQVRGSLPLFQCHNQS